MESRNRSFLKGALFGALFVCLAGFTLWSIRGPRALDKKTEQKLVAIQELTRQVYLYETDAQTLDDSLLKGYLLGYGDPYSAYYDQEETQTMLELTEGVHQGEEVKTVHAELLEDGTAYLGVSLFTDRTPEQFSGALQELRESGATRLLVDLRDNPGGSFEAVVEMLRQMMPEGLLVYTEDKEGRREEFVNQEDHTLEMPLVLLVNENTASAAEIFAGAVQDYGMATVVGTRTYGKGVVQRLYTFQDGTSLRLTISTYYTPKGRSIQGEGISPDVEAAYDAALGEAGRDTQLEEALSILRGK